MHQQVEEKGLAIVKVPEAGMICGGGTFSYDGY